jgi:uncharacterized protein
MLAFFFRRRTVTQLIVIAAILLVLQFLLYTGFAYSLYSLQAEALAPGASAETLHRWAEVQRGFVATPQEVQQTLGLYRGGYPAIVAHSLNEKWMGPLNSLWQAGGETLAYMLLGMAALKAGFLTGAWAKRRYLKIAAIGFGIGIPLYAAIAWWLIGQDFDMPALVTGWLAATVPVRPFMIVAIAATIILLTRRGGWLAERIAAAGRAAFTNYLGTSILMTLLFYGYGLSLFGHLSRIQLWLPVIGAWAIMLLWSKPWLDRFNYGPFEWLWRSLARLRFQPMRKRAGPSSASSG